MKKDVGMRIGLDRELRDEFLAARQIQDRPVAQVIWKFMRDYVRKNAEPSGVKSKVWDKQTG